MGTCNNLNESEGLVGISDMTFKVEDNAIILNESDLTTTTDDVDQKRTKGENEEAESISIIKEISQILNTELSSKALEICLRLVEEGADHTAVAQLLINWRRMKNPSKYGSLSKTENEWRT